jgi:hypothetical protein
MTEIIATARADPPQAQEGAVEEQQTVTTRSESVEVVQETLSPEDVLAI